MTVGGGDYGAISSDFQAYFIPLETAKIMKREPLRERERAVLWLTVCGSNKATALGTRFLPVLAHL